MRERLYLNANHLAGTRFRDLGSEMKMPVMYRFENVVGLYARQSMQILL